MVRLEVDDPVATICIDRPDKLGAFTYGVIDDIRAAVNAAVADERVVGIVVTGSGRAFSAGLDGADAREDVASLLGRLPPRFARRKGGTT